MNVPDNATSRSNSALDAVQPYSMHVSGSKFHSPSTADHSATGIRSLFGFDEKEARSHSAPSRSDYYWAAMVPRYPEGRLGAAT